MEEYERRMDPIEQRISQKLKELFGGWVRGGGGKAHAGVEVGGH